MCIMVRLSAADLSAGHSGTVAGLVWLSLPWQAYTEQTGCSATHLRSWQLVCGVGMPDVGLILI